MGDITGHIALSRIDWFSRMGAPGSQVLAQQANAVRDKYSNMDPALAGDAAALVNWLECSGFACA
jgi:hypothetical protein